MDLIVSGLEGAIAAIESIGMESFTEAMFTEVAMFAMLRIKVRTQEGKDYMERPFEPYTPKYAAFRDKRGHPSSKVNLTFSGRMLGQGMTFEANDTSARLFFADTSDPDNEKVTQAEKAYYNSQRREFFRLNEGDIAEIMAIVDGHFQKTVFRRRK